MTRILGLWVKLFLFRRVWEVKIPMSLLAFSGISVRQRSPDNLIISETFLVFNLSCPHPVLLLSVLLGATGWLSIELLVSVCAVSAA